MHYRTREITLLSLTAKQVKFFDLQRDHTMLMGDMCTTVYLRTKNGINTLVQFFSNYKQTELFCIPQHSDHTHS